MQTVNMLQAKSTLSRLVEAIEQGRERDLGRVEQVHRGNVVPVPLRGPERGDVQLGDGETDRQRPGG